jgi:hypothetical protein
MQDGEKDGCWFMIPLRKVKNRAEGSANTKRRSFVDPLLER